MSHRQAKSRCSLETHPIEGPGLAVAALAQPDCKGWELHVYGKRPEEGPCRRLASRSGVADRVHFHSWRPRNEVLAAISNTDALLFPSMHDAAGWVVAEAASVGTPVVCLDRGGPPVLADGPGHVHVEVSENVVAGLARGLSQVASSPRLAPTDRWDAARLPALLSDWYERVARVD